MMASGGISPNQILFTNGNVNAISK